MLKPKKRLEGDITYMILMDEYQDELPFMFPVNINETALDYLKFFPKNLFQFETPEHYLKYEINNIESNPYNVIFYKRSDQEEILSFLKKNHQLIIILTELPKDLKLLNNIRSIDSTLIYTINVDEESKGKEINNLLSQLINNKNTLFKNLKISNDSSENINVKIEDSLLQEYEYFLPTKNNHLVLNNIIGNFSYQDYNDKEIMAKESEKALKQKDTFNRLNLYLKQVKSLDNLTEKYKLTEPFLSYFPELKPIIISLPFNNPDIIDFLPVKNKDVKKIIDSIQIEQTSNYINETSLSNDKKIDILFITRFKDGAEFLKQKLRFLDSIAFLISSFNFSPYVRLPILGKSLNRELSFISPKNFHKFLTMKSQFKVSDTIFKIGRNISEKTISKEFEKYIANRNSQIIAISDLPFEWININKVPISFTHDITRIPETTQNNLIHSFVFNSYLDFVITKDIIKKTLVIVGTDDIEFTKWHSILSDSSTKMGFVFEKCLSKKSFIEAIKKFNPEFLIIDSHGGFDEVKKETFIKIGTEKLTHKLIVENSIIVPLVFISACGTAPVYGTFNPIANAFLQMGSRSVTSTFLPIDIDSSTMIYLTILNNLDSTSKKGSFNNWLEYICFNIRSSFLHRTFISFIEENPEYEKKYYELIDNVLYFKKRSSVFDETIKIQNLIPRKIYKNNKSKYFEFLYYTNIGRGDLVLFEKNKEQFRKKNYS